MNLRSLFTRTIKVPESNETRTVEVPCLWFVRWESTNSTTSGDGRPEAEAFTSEAEAIAFRDSLINAAKLLRYRKSWRRNGENCPLKFTIEEQIKSDS